MRQIRFRRHSPLGVGEAAFFRRDTWHHGMSEGPGPLRVLELFSPPPARGTSQAYAQTRPYLETSTYVQDRWLGRWPQAAQDARRAFTMKVLRPADLLWRLEGASQAALVGLLVSTEHLTAGMMRVLPGQSTGERVHGGDCILYLVAGQAKVELPGAGTFALDLHDAFYVPDGISYRVVNADAAPAELLFGVAPTYLRNE